MRKRAKAGMTMAIGMASILLCASCTSMRGAWYYQTREAPGAGIAGDSTQSSDGGRAEDSKTMVGCDDAGLYFAVVNDKREAITVTEVQINGLQAGDAGWTCSGRQPLKRGQLLVLKLPVTAAARCAVPLRAWLWREKSNLPVPIRVSGSMPSALPGVWLQCPSAAAATCVDRSSGSELLRCEVAAQAGQSDKVAVFSKRD